MWRREERLKYWLEIGSRTKKPGSRSGLKEKLLLKIQLGQSNRAVKDESLRISIDAKSLDNALDISAQIKEGLGLSGDIPASVADFSSGLADHERTVRDFKLLGAAHVRNLDLPDERRARIRQEKVDITPTHGSVPINLTSAEVKMLETLYGQMPQVKDGNRLLIPDPLIQNQTSQISDLPHARASIQLDQMKDAERGSFLREAQILKGISCDKAELLAVFRHVPIELISRLRFLSGQKAILYGISHGVKPTHTRVHDMAAIRDVSSQEVHLIPHRTKYRSVSFS
jgi:hypothetical protein